MPQPPNDDTNTTRAELDSKNVKLEACDLCQHTAWTINAGTFFIAENTMRPREGIPLRVIVCNHCGNVRLLHALTLGTTH